MPKKPADEATPTPVSLTLGERAELSLDSDLLRLTLGHSIDKPTAAVVTAKAISS